VRRLWQLGTSVVMLASAAVHSALAQIADSANGVRPVTRTEVELPGFGSYPDSAVVRQRYGKPWRRDMWFQHDGDSAERWYYRTRAVYLDVGGGVIAIEYTTPGPRTKRGLQVGDSATRVVALYGRPRYLNDDDPTPNVLGDGLWRYPGQTGVLSIMVRHGRVTGILMGSDLTNE
jgi:hypothetical protein